MANILVPSRQSFFDDKGNFTLVAFRFFEELTELANETSVDVESSGSSSSFSAQLQQVRKELNGLPEFTMDTEGFTMDTTDFTMDKVIA